jgi:hypothetical protein
MKNRFTGLAATMVAFPVFLGLSLVASTSGLSASAPVPELAPSPSPVAASAAPSPSASPSVPPSAAAAAPVPPSGALKGNELNIIYTTNIIGEIDPCG